jgi:histidinol dehydrogenase
MESLSRKIIIEESFARSFAVVVKSMDEAIELMNGYAPEHLEIVVEQGEAEILDRIVNAGSIFLGPYSSEPLGDYATGSNHTIPTSGGAKMFSALSTESFGKMVQIQKVSLEGIQSLRKTVETLAQCEGLDAHARAVSVRFQSLSESALETPPAQGGRPELILP